MFHPIAVSVLMLLFTASNGVYSQKEISLIGKPTSQSSHRAFGGEPGKAVDGNKNGVWGANTCTHTVRGNKYAWWMVNQESSECVSKIVIYNRVDCCPGRLTGATVRIGDDSNGSNNPVCGTVSAAQVNGGSKIEVPCTTNLEGQYLSIHQAAGGQPLTLCEVQAYDGVCEPIENQSEESCRPLWTQFQDNCYRSFAEKKTWHDAEDECLHSVALSKPAHVVSIHSQDENDFVYELLTSSSGSTDVWIGFHDTGSEGNFEWSDGTEGGYDNWDVTEPNNAGSGEDCTHIWRTYGKWNDRKCNSKLPYICKMPTE